MNRAAIGNDITILLAEDNDGHARLVVENFKEAGVMNEILRFHDGEETLNFFFGTNGRRAYQPGRGYLLLLDIRMPKVDGVEVLTKLKGAPEFRKLPVIMLTTTDDPHEIDRCHQLGCNCYVTKPVGFQAFTDALRSLGLFLMVIEVPKLGQ